jgi:hypothetical protein
LNPKPDHPPFVDGENGRVTIRKGRVVLSLTLDEVDLLAWRLHDAAIKAKKRETNDRSST